MQGSCKGFGTHGIVGARIEDEAGRRGMTVA
jgi:hypothetical protein